MSTTPPPANASTIARAPTPPTAATDDPASHAAARTPSTDVDSAINDVPTPLSPSRHANGNNFAVNADCGAAPAGARTPARRSGKRALTHKPKSAFTPNVNPNYVAPSPGTTPQSVRPEASPYGKRACHDTTAEAGAAVHGAAVGATADTEPTMQPPALTMPEASDHDMYLEDTAPHIDASGPAAPVATSSPVMRKSHRSTTITDSKNAGSNAISAAAIPVAMRSASQSMRPVSASSAGGSKGGDAGGLRQSLMSLDPLRLSLGPGGTVNCEGARHDTSMYCPDAS